MTALSLPEFNKCLHKALRHKVWFLRLSCAGQEIGLGWSLQVSAFSGYSDSVILSYFNIIFKQYNHSSLMKEVEMYKYKFKWS